VLTASGDSTAHIWQCAVHLFGENSAAASGRVASSEEDYGEAGESVEMSESFVLDDLREDYSVLRTPLRSLSGHAGVVIAADWLPGGEHAVTAGWDRLACIWDTNTGQGPILQNSLFLPKTSANFG
jgi:WD40 repeat protein